MAKLKQYAFFIFQYLLNDEQQLRKLTEHTHGTFNVNGTQHTKYMKERKNWVVWECGFVISAYRPVPLKSNSKKKKRKQIRSCLTFAICKLWQRFCATESYKFLRFRRGYLMCVKQEIDFDDPLEDKINTKRRFTCNYRSANICNTSITKDLSALPFKHLRCTTNMTQMMLSSCIAFTAPEDIRACPKLGPTTAVLHIRENRKD